MWTLLFAQLAGAGQLAGVTMPDTATVGGQPVVLNGMGLREKYFIDVYVGGLYLPQKTIDSTTAITSDGPKRLTMHFVYKAVTKDQQVESYEEGLKRVPNGVAQARSFRTLYEMLEDVHSGDRILFDYTPGTGTTVTVKGAVKGTIEGSGFMNVLWGVYLGSSPPTVKLKNGMLGR